jgi:hypothetical protein
MNIEINFSSETLVLFRFLFCPDNKIIYSTCPDYIIPLIAYPPDAERGVNSINGKNRCIVMLRIKKNKPQISADARSFRSIRRLHLNRTYMPIKIGAVIGYILLGMMSASTSMFGILVGAMFRIAGY